MCDHIRVSTGQGKFRENLDFVRSGKFQGIISIVMENGIFLRISGKYQGKMKFRDFHHRFLGELTKTDTNSQKLKCL